MAICHEAEFIDEQDTLSAKQHGGQWARAAELAELRRLLWMDKVWRGNVLEDLGAIAFAYIVIPDRAKDVESARAFWQDMAGFTVEDWDQSEILLAFLDGALPIARERVGDLVVEPVTIKRNEEDEEQQHCLLSFEEGLARGREWATTRADSSEVEYLRVFGRAFQSTSGPVWLVTEYGAEMLVRSFVFMVKPDDVSAPYRAAWKRMIGKPVPEPWDFDFAHGFVLGAVNSVCPPHPIIGQRRIPMPAASNPEVTAER
jgi:hypothetical protein